MTNDEWMKETNPLKLISEVKDKRKARLFAVACCKQIIRFIKDQRSIDAIHGAEKLADNLLTTEEIKTISQNVVESVQGFNASDASFAAHNVFLNSIPFYIMRNALNNTARYNQTKQNSIVKDIYLPTVPIITTNENIVSIAKEIYKTQDYSLLRNLKDALTTLNNNSFVLAHCDQETHYKGCWLIDAILSNQTA